METQTSEPRLDKERHMKYWKRCASTYLPHHYTFADSTRLMWACFIFSAQDLLSMPIAEHQRASIRNWVLSLQHPEGGFCGSSTHSHTGQYAHKGEANIAATFFALILLSVATEGDGNNAFHGVKRSRLLIWLRKLQRTDGSFGQNIWEGEAVGGKDTRHSYFASAIRWMLRGDLVEGTTGWVEDINVEKMVKHIRSGQTYDGGLAEVSLNESHAGYVYTSVAALAFVDRPASTDESISHDVPDRTGLLKFLAGRQFAYLEEEENECEEDEAENFVEAQLASLSLENGCTHVGYNGRWNKKADTCYCWWVAASLKMLNANFNGSVAPSRRYLFDITQHAIGGFGKVGGAPPDIYHSYLGLAALATMGDEDLKEFDVGLCCTLETTRKIEKARDGLLQGRDRDWEDGFWSP